MSNYYFLQELSFLKAKDSGDYYYFSNVGLNLFTWDDVIYEFNRIVTSKEQFKIFENLGFTLREGNNLPYVKPFTDQYAMLDLTAPVSAHCYVSFLEISKSFGRHRDKADVLSWQVIGKTKWIVDTLNGVREHILEPNDAIFVPKTMYHEVIPLTPRVSISFGLDYPHITLQ